ncbi:MAG: PAS domain S-box protein [Oligoflexia bacterium]|nr:PAS domain S-box protein [Oligoflexia bacterium]
MNIKNKFGKKNKLIYFYVLAIVCSIIAIWVQHFLQSEINKNLPPFLLSYPMLFLVAWIGGLGPALLATAITGFGVKYFIFPHELSLTSPENQLIFFVFATMGILFSTIVPGIQKMRIQQKLFVSLDRLHRFELMVQHARNAIFIIRCEDGRILECNNAAIELYGYQRNEFLNMTVKDLLMDKSQITTFYGDIEYGNTPREVLHERKDGSVFTVEESCKHSTLIEGVEIIVSVAQDITERKRIEEISNQSKKSLLFHLENLPIAIIEWDNRLVISGWKGAAEKIFGWSASEVVGKKIHDSPFIYDQDISKVNEVIAKLTSFGSTGVVGRIRNLTKNGQIIYCIWRNSVLTDDFGKMVSVMSIIENISEQVKIEDALRDSEERLSLALDIAELGTWTFDVDSKKAWRSLRHGQIFGYTPPLPDWSFGMFLDHVMVEDRFRIKELTTQSIENMKAFRFECRIQRVDGVIRWIEVMARPQIIGKKVLTIVGVVRDITEIKESDEIIRRSERLYRAIGETLDYGIWICDAKARNTYASDSFLKLLGITQEQCSEFGWGNTLHPDYASETMIAWKECASSGKFWEREHLFRGVDGKWHPILARGIPICNQNGEIIEWVGINLDISKIKQTEQQLRDAIAARDEFLSIASHELKNPLSILTLQIELMTQLLRNVPLETDRLLSLCSDGEESIIKLNKLINELLDVTRIRSGQLSINRQLVNLQTLAEEAVKAMSEDAGKTGSIITIKNQNSGPPICGKWDLLRLNQVFVNLLSNAIKYGKGKPIEVIISYNEKNHHAIFIVRDNGVGISEEFQERIFQRFERGVSADLFDGLGLGLYIVHKIIEGHNGVIRVKSEIDKGSEFIVELPL